MVFSPAGRGNFLYLKISDPPWVPYDIMTPGAGWNQVSVKTKCRFGSPLVEIQRSPEEHTLTIIRMRIPETISPGERWSI